MYGTHQQKGERLYYIEGGGLEEVQGQGKGMEWARVRWHDQEVDDTERMSCPVDNRRAWAVVHSHDVTARVRNRLPCVCLGQGQRCPPPLRPGQGGPATLRCVSFPV